MALFGGIHAASSDAPVPQRVMRLLAKARDERRTGCMTVTDAATDAVARLYAFEGGLYAAEIDGFVPDLGARLRAAGRLTDAQAQAAHSTGGGAPAGRIAVAQGWVPAPVVASAHQEMLLAVFGAVAALGRVRVEWAPDAVTDAGCTLPLPLDALVATVHPRAERLHADWRQCGASAGPDDVAFAPTGAPLPATVLLPELGALLDSLDGVRSVDACAASCGFTRAEAVHLLAALVGAGCAQASGDALDAGDGRLLVPEALGARRVTVPAVVAAPIVEPVVVEPVVVEPVVVEPVVVEPVVVEPVAAPLPEPSALPSEPLALPSEPELEPEPPADDFALAALRAELATAEFWAAELRARLARAEAAREQDVRADADG